MELWIATGNDHKMAEFRMLLQSTGLTLKSQKELLAYFSPPETGKTFLDNAKIKAKSLFAVKPDQWVMAEDSGICADGLSGQPGIYSARYAGDNATDVENTAKLLQMLRIRSPTKREASFISCIVIRNPKGEEFSFEGKLSGKITEAARGTTGFGYDPVFIPEGETKTLAELGDAFKNRISHRAKAVQAALHLFR